MTTSTTSRELCSAAEPSSEAGSLAAARAFSSLAILDATPAGRIAFASEKAKALLAKFYCAGIDLPETLVRCLKGQSSAPLMVWLPWTTQAGGKHLGVRLIGKQQNHLQLLLEERMLSVSVDRLRAAFGLTPREAEVLLWIAQGKTSSEIAAILFCKTATVTKHTEHIFAKLGVETRTAAAATARGTID